jgi:hypothetical protein
MMVLLKAMANMTINIMPISLSPDKEGLADLYIALGLPLSYS